MTRAFWKPKEVEILDRLVGNYPAPQVIKRFNRIAKKELGDEYNERSRNSILQKSVRLAGSIKPTMKNFTIMELANILGVDSQRVYKWRYSGALQVSKSGYTTVVKDKYLQALADNHPHLLAACSESGLIELFGEEKTKWILSHPVKNRYSVKIVSPEGIEYANRREAARLTGIKLSTITYYLKEKTKNWMTYDEYQVYKNTFYKMKTYPIYLLNINNFEVEKKLCTNPPGIRRRRFYVVDGNETHIITASSQLHVYYSLEVLKDTIKQIHESQVSNYRNAIKQIQYLESLESVPSAV